MSKQKYRPITVHFDPTDLDGDRKILDWLEKNKSKTSSYSALIRKALEEFMMKHEIEPYVERYMKQAEELTIDAFKAFNNNTQLGNNIHWEISNSYYSMMFRPFFMSHDHSENERFCNEMIDRVYKVIEDCNKKYSKNYTIIKEHCIKNPSDLQKKSRLEYGSIRVSKFDKEKNLKL